MSAIVMLSLFTLACQKPEATTPPPGEQIQGFRPDAPEQLVPRDPETLDSENYCHAEYYFRGKERESPAIPFGRCTRDGDYMLLRRGKGKPFKKPILAIRVRVNEKVTPVLTDTTFSLTQDDKALKPDILDLQGKDGWLGELRWNLDPDWQKIRINTDVMGRDPVSKVIRPTTAMFGLNVFNETVEWPRFAKPNTKAAGKGDAVTLTGPCFP